MTTITPPFKHRRHRPRAIRRARASLDVPAIEWVLSGRGAKEYAYVLGQA